MRWSIPAPSEGVLTMTQPTKSPESRDIPGSSLARLNCVWLQALHELLTRVVYHRKNFRELEAEGYGPEG
jgi:hypothetical protein